MQRRGICLGRCSRCTGCGGCCTREIPTVEFSYHNIGSGCEQAELLEESRYVLTSLYSEHHLGHVHSCYGDEVDVPRRNVARRLIKQHVSNKG